MAAPAWQSADVGAVGIAGSTSFGAGSITVTGAGADVFGTADAFRFVHQPLVGDRSITARVASMTVPDAWCKVGVMIRETTSPSSTHAFMALTGSNGLAFQRRTVTGGASATTAGGAATAPRWLRLARSGALPTGAASVDGATWTTVGSVSIAMATTVDVGLAVCPRRSGATCTAVFDGVSVTGAPAAPQGVGMLARPPLEGLARSP